MWQVNLAGSSDKRSTELEERRGAVLLEGAQDVVVHVHLLRLQLPHGGKLHPQVEAAAKARSRALIAYYQTAEGQAAAKAQGPAISDRAALASESRAADNIFSTPGRGFST